MLCCWGPVRGVVVRVRVENGGEEYLRRHWESGGRNGVLGYFLRIGGFSLISLTVGCEWRGAGRGFSDEWDY